ncbi:PEP-CTERM-box response regulator transcription factor [Exilibacterium tricleocarpae]|uniref:PEP-CTERM-box response regulator transcription factor n=1 Tax=Exilibacterium tricleocarpae TaxID=2591008 RepID=A0A545T3F4_9GAMM|nr:PEP-CTERM-box response regulator transcription factor [Exilibacterium tricleocarpae]TQV71742.1 PEP-CTERM-box response regulator transcription factor [Exilibacterium tricleocarpae]
MSKTNQNNTLLIVEDDEGLQSQLRWHFDQHQVVIAGDRAGAIEAIRLHEPPVVIQDLGLPPDDEGVEEGFLCVQEISKLAPNTKIIVMTGNADYENAVRAVAMGAYDFYQKPVDTDTLDLIVQRAYQMYQLEERNRNLLDMQQSPLEGIITADPAMMKICRMLEKLAPTNVTCTLMGESGTGKEVLTRALHNLSPRKDKRFVAINCAAVPENLMESELFGYEKGAFTGAAKRTNGKIENAHQGTLFLDEIGDMPLNLQAKLLRFLQERVIERLGGHEEIPVDVRVICATNKNLPEMVRDGTFREDLYYRICEMEINVPPLRERQGDKILISRHILKRIAKDQSQNITGFTREAVEAIEGYSWPGNIRELENKLKRAVIMCEEKSISPIDLGLHSAENIDINLRQVRQKAEKAAIQRALAISDNNISATAKLLGVTRPTLYDLLKKYDIQLTQ